MSPLTRTSLVFAALACGTTAAAQPPGPDPRLESAISTILISQVERSVQFAKTMPQPEKPKKPAVDQGEAVKVHDDVYVDRRLMPNAGASYDESSVRVFRKDAR
jgi:hypothetical protein